jgi:hypothetical protein
MKATLESTSKVVRLKVIGNNDGIQARIWEGHTESGIPFHAFVVRVGVEEGLPAEKYAEFQESLNEVKAPSPEIEAYPMRMVL